MAYYFIMLSKCLYLNQTRVVHFTKNRLFYRHRSSMMDEIVSSDNHEQGGEKKLAQIGTFTFFHEDILYNKFDWIDLDWKIQSLDRWLRWRNMAFFFFWSTVKKLMHNKIMCWRVNWLWKLAKWQCQNRKEQQLHLKKKHKAFRIGFLSHHVFASN